MRRLALGDLAEPACALLGPPFTYRLSRSGGGLFIHTCMHTAFLDYLSVHFFVRVSLLLSARGGTLQPRRYDAHQ